MSRISGMVSDEPLMGWSVLWCCLFDCLLIVSDEPLIGWSSPIRRVLQVGVTGFTWTLVGLKRHSCKGLCDEIASFRRTFVGLKLIVQSVRWPAHSFDQDIVGLFVEQIGHKPSSSDDSAWFEGIDVKNQIGEHLINKHSLHLILPILREIRSSCITNFGKSLERVFSVACRGGSLVRANSVFLPSICD